MIDTQAIRSKILDLAMRGQLTEQLPEDGTAEELYQEILEEKQKLIKEGKIKKQKPLPKITDEEIPFEIPENWKWVRLGAVFRIEMGQSPDGNSVHSNGEGIEFHQGKVCFGTKIINDSGQRTTQPTKIAEADSVLLCVRAPVGKVNITKRRICIGRGLCAISAVAYTELDFLYYSLITCEKSFVNQATGSTFAAIGGNIIKRQTIPLPPFAEQKRIVKKIDQAFSVLDTIDKLQAQYADNLTALKSKLIDAAIQGKLTKQLPEDGTAEELYQQIQEEKQRLIEEGKIKKQKPLPKISDDEIPFDIPDNWKWTRFADILDVRDGTHDTPKYVTDGIPLVTSKNLRNGLIDFESAKLISYEDAKQINNRSRVDDGDILLAMIGTIGNPVLVKKDREFSIKNIALFKPIDSNLLDMSFVLCYLKNEERVMQEKARGGLQPFVSLKILRTSIIPLPPLAEQKRIVKKLDEILPICERKIK